MNDKYTTPHYLLDLQRRAAVQHDTLDPKHGDERDTSIDRTRLRREWQANVYGVITGCVGAFVGGWLLGLWL